jgi:translation initiation factor 2B subunit (eIF-2B alpha/beta/delta family)
MSSSNRKEQQAETTSLLTNSSLIQQATALHSFYLDAQLQNEIESLSEEIEEIRNFKFALRKLYLMLEESIRKVTYTPEKGLSLLTSASEIAKETVTMIREFKQNEYDLGKATQVITKYEQNCNRITKHYKDKANVRKNVCIVTFFALAAVATIAALTVGLLFAGLGGAVLGFGLGAMVMMLSASAIEASFKNKETKRQCVDAAKNDVATNARSIIRFFNKKDSPQGSDVQPIQASGNKI